MSNWPRRFLRLANHLAVEWSKDNSTKVGCVLVNPRTNAVIATGVNGFARGVEEHPTSPRWTRPTKYLWCEHAERNAIYNAARHGHPTDGCVAYLNWNPTTSICCACARAFIQCGIVAVYGPQNSVQQPAGFVDDSGWRTECTTAAAMLAEAGVKVEVLPL